MSQLLDRLIILKKGKIQAIFSSGELNSDIEQENDLRSFNNQALKATMEDPDVRQLVSIEGVQVSNKGYSLNQLVNFNLNCGECMALIGENGIG